MIRVLVGDVRERLKDIADESVHCVVTSPPYFGLRDYGTASWEGGDPGCGHVEKRARNDVSSEDLARRADQFGTGTGAGSQVSTMQFRGDCPKCGATRTDKQIGLEPTPAAFVAALVDVFRAVRRVLRPDGTLWLNLGDSYATGAGSGRSMGGNVFGKSNAVIDAGSYPVNQANRMPLPGLKPKDLIGIPWRVAFALQADGWYLRQDIIWAKPNPMPESVTDRCTKAHEYLFLLTKSARYYFDAEAIAEPITESSVARLSQDVEAQAGSDGVPGKTNGRMKAVGRVRGVPPRHAAYESSDQSGLDEVGRGGTRNKRSVWTIATQPYSEAHFATFPPDLVAPCILAGTSEKGCCSKCGAPWIRQTIKATEFHGGSGAAGRTAEEVNATGKWSGVQSGNVNLKLSPVVSTKTLGWSPSCSCHGHFEERDGPPDWISDETGERKKIRVYVPDKDAPPSVRCMVLDPFGGAGTTALVADRLGRGAAMIELNPEYAALIERRIRGDAGMFASFAAE